MTIDSIGNVSIQTLPDHSLTTPPNTFEEPLLLAQTHSQKIQYGRNLKDTEKLIKEASQLYNQHIERLAKTIGVDKSAVKLGDTWNLINPYASMIKNGIYNSKVADALQEIAFIYATSPNPPLLINANSVQQFANLVSKLATAQERVAAFAHQFPPDKILKDTALHRTTINRLHEIMLITKNDLENAIESFKAELNTK